MECTSESGLTRDNLSSRIVEVLNRGGWANPDVFLVRAEHGERVVVKDFAPRRAWVRLLLGRAITRRESRAYRALDGCPGIPRLREQLDPLALVIEYRPGTLLSRSLAGTLPPEFLAELRQAVRSMHERGVVHLDLRHRSNVLAGDDGHPVLIDFASALRFRPGSVFARLFQPLLQRIDWGAVRKWEVRVADQSTSPQTRDS